MLPLPIPFFFFFFSLSLRCWVYSYGPLYSTPEYFLHPSLCPLSHLLRCWSRPVQAQLSPSPTLPKTRYPHGGTAGCFPHLFLALLSTVSPGKNSNSVSLSFFISVNRFLLLSCLPVMTKDTSSPTPSVAELNACVSPSGGGHNHRPAAKETTFREWMMANQIGMRFILNGIELGGKGTKNENKIK